MLELNGIKEKLLAIILTSGVDISNGLDALIDFILDNDDTLTYAPVSVVKETDKAWMFNISFSGRDGNCVQVNTTAWMPKSQCDILTDGNDHYLIMPRWLERKKIHGKTIKSRVVRKGNPERRTKWT